MIKRAPIFSISFRPFFLLAALIAVINPSLWIPSYLGEISLPLSTVDPMFWHAHEMIFGFSGALIAGFILTASANWTSSRPYQGNALLLLVVLWLIERMSYFVIVNDHLQFIVMNLFFPALTIMLLRKLWSFPRQRNVFMPIILGVTLAKIFHSWGGVYSMGALEVSGREIAVGLVRFIVLLIAGRVIPFFTRKRIQGAEIAVPSWLNPASLAPIALLAIPWPESFPSSARASILFIALALNTVRQIMWRPQITFRVPILFVLHVGVGLINLGLLMEFVGVFYEQVHFTQAALHLMMAGGLGLVGMGIMTRVTLGHTGRVIKADFWTCVSYISILFGGFIRVFIPILYSDFYIKSLHIASGLWTLGFAIFIIRYFKILVSKRPDGKSY